MKTSFSHFLWPKVKFNLYNIFGVYQSEHIEKKFNLVTEQFRNIKVSTDKIQSRAEKIQDLEGIKTEEIKK